MAYQLEIRLLLGESLLESGNTAGALEVLRSADRFMLCDVQAAAHLPRILFVRARALEHLGRAVESARELDRLLGMWTNAEPELPLLAAARAMRAHLAPAAP